MKNPFQHYQIYGKPNKGGSVIIFFVNSQFKKLIAGCPMAGLMALEVFSQIPDLKESEQAQNAFATLEFHWNYKKRFIISVGRKSSGQSNTHLPGIMRYILLKF